MAPNTGRTAPRITWYANIMTMILIGMNDVYAVQVSDRRLSWLSEIVEEEHGKSFVLILPAIRLSVAFTGLAKIGSYSTSDFLFNQLIEIGKTDFDAISIINRLVASLNHRFMSYRDIGNLQRPQRALTVTFAGYNNSMSPPGGIAAQVTNTQSVNGEFVATFESERRPDASRKIGETFTWLGAFGNGAALDLNDMESVRNDLKRRVPPIAIAGRFDKIIRRLSADHRSGQTIGKQTDHILIYSDPSKPSEGGRSSAVVRPEATMVGSVMISPGGQVAAFKDISIAPVEADTPALSIPTVHRNQPCPCGSGKKYRNCHRNWPGS